MSFDELSEVPTESQRGIETRDLDAVGETGESKKRKKKGGSAIAILLSVLLICGGVAIGFYAYLTKIPRHAGPGSIFDLQGNVVIPDDPSATSSAFLEAAEMVIDDGGKGFNIPAVQLNVPLGSINDVNGVMNPPNFTSAFWIRNRGVSLANAEQGTVYIVTHATRFGLAPGNYLQAREATTLTPGDIININDRVYSFESAEIIAQSKIGEYDYLWDESIPNRALIITCLLRNDNAAPTDNLVIIGKLVS